MQKTEKAAYETLREKRLETRGNPHLWASIFSSATRGCTTLSHCGDTLPSAICAEVSRMYLVHRQCSVNALMHSLPSRCGRKPGTRDKRVMKAQGSLLGPL